MRLTKEQVLQIINRDTDLGASALARIARVAADYKNEGPLWMMPMGYAESMGNLGVANIKAYMPKVDVMCDPQYLGETPGLGEMLDLLGVE